VELEPARSWPPTVHNLSGVHASVDLAALEAPRELGAGLVPPRATAALMLRLTAGVAPPPEAPPATVTVRVAYWCDAAQPPPGLVRALADPATQAVGRALSLALAVTVLPLLGVCALSAGPPPAPASALAPLSEDGGAPPDAAAGRRQRWLRAQATALSVSVARTGAPLRCSLCVCEAAALRALLAAAAGGGAAATAALAALAAQHRVTPLPECEALAELTFVAARFDTRDRWTAARGGKPAARRPLVEQLRAAARSYAAGVVVVWRLAASEVELLAAVADNPGGAASFGFVTLPEQVGRAGGGAVRPRCVFHSPSRLTRRSPSSLFSALSALHSPRLLSLWPLTLSPFTPLADAAGPPERAPAGPGGDAGDAPRWARARDM